jgi:hypothetical protein
LQDISPMMAFDGCCFSQARGSANHTPAAAAREPTQAARIDWPNDGRAQIDCAAPAASVAS